MRKSIRAATKQPGRSKRNMKKIAVAGAGACLALGVIAGPLVSASAAPAKVTTHGGLKVKVTGATKNVKNGQHTIAHVSHAKPGGSYDCLEGIFNAKNPKHYFANIGTLTLPNASAKGTFVCNIVFHPFSGKDHTGGKKLSCPVTKAEKKAGFSCGLAVANTKNTKQNANVTFTAKK
jgi:hypothetical protein